MEEIDSPKCLDVVGIEFRFVVFILDVDTDSNEIGLRTTRNRNKEQPVAVLDVGRHSMDEKLPIVTNRDTIPRNDDERERRRPMAFSSTPNRNHSLLTLTSDGGKEHGIIPDRKA